MEPNEKKVEAILFTVGKEITSERIASLCELSIEEVDKIVEKLSENYQQRNHSLHIIKKEDSWKLTVRDEFVPLVSSIASTMEMEQPLMETLAVIAWKYPVVQSEIIKMRHTTAYDHIRQLEERGFIAKERFGRTYKIKLTKKFFEYFDLPSEEAKKAFLGEVPPEVLREAEDVEKETDEVERLIELDERQKAAKGEIQKAVKGVKQSGGEVSGETKGAEETREEQKEPTLEKKD